MITGEDSIQDVIKKYPKTRKLLGLYGFTAFGCG